MSLSDIPRKIKEKAEEIGEKSEKAYHEKREEPVRQAAQQHYEEKHKEAREKLAKGDISRDLYEKRNAKYLKQRDAEAEPLERRVVHSAKDVAETVAKGAKEVAAKVEQDYRPGPQPRFKVGRATKGRVAPAARRSSRADIKPDFGRSTINFGNSSGFGGGSRGGAVDFTARTIGGGPMNGYLDFSAPLFGKKKGK
jgi:hypothetical protein